MEEDYYDIVLIQVGKQGQDAGSCRELCSVSFLLSEKAKDFPGKTEETRGWDKFSFVLSLINLDDTNRYMLTCSHKLNIRQKKRTISKESTS